MITLKQLEALRHVVETGSIARAAQQLYTTESALSKRLQELEQGLAVPLFDRSGRSLVLTSTGRVVLEMASDLLARRDAVLDIASSPNFEGRVFRLGMTEFIAAGWLTQLLEGVRQRYPGVDLEPRIGLTDDLMRDLAVGDLDVVIVPRSAMCAGFETQTLFVSPNTWVGAPGLADGLGVLTPAKIGAFSLILQPRSSALDTSVRRWFEDNQIPMPKVISCNSLAGVKSLAIAGFGIVPLPQAYCAADVEAGRLSVLDVRPRLVERVYCAVRQPGSALGLAAQMSGVVQQVLGTATPQRVKVRKLTAVRSKKVNTPRR
ncbi:LysR family transcriptional regulator [Hydrogenophaga sp.]|uniref:LysR family transcriptional regulator n=1 Tax=Hydrogenophaga sp. TaxID=1904254 RepID=UPI0027240F74|nr:LysR family transcriptional regulator [Hydrogenophaga sp.]MDO9437918.1 LysR family transcriptional regulator [Hydrogenophaga sp.]